MPCPYFAKLPSLLAADVIIRSLYIEYLVDVPPRRIHNELGRGTARIWRVPLLREATLQG